MAIYIVCDGIASQADDGFRGSATAPAGVYGADWIVVEALSSKAAVDAGRAYDAGEPAGPNALVYDAAHARAKLTSLRGDG